MRRRQGGARAVLLRVHRQDLRGRVGRRRAEVRVVPGRHARGGERHASVDRRAVLAARAVAVGAGGVTRQARRRVAPTAGERDRGRGAGLLGGRAGRLEARLHPRGQAEGGARARREGRLPARAVPAARGRSLRGAAPGRARRRRRHARDAGRVR